MESVHKIFIHPLVLGCFSGVLGILALRLPDGWVFVFIALVPLLYAIERADSMGKSFIVGTLTGVMLAGAGSWWMLDSLPLPVEYGVPHIYEGYLFVITSWCVVIVAIGICMGAWVAVLACLRLDRLWKLLFAGALFLFSELVSLIFFNIVTAAPDVSNPLFYSAGFLGYPLADNPSFLQAASIGGIWALSAIAIAVNLLVFYCLRASPRVRRNGLLSVALVLILVAIVPVDSLRAYFDTSARMPVMVGYMSIGTTVHGVSEESFENETTDDALTSLVKAEAGGAHIILIPEAVPLFPPVGSITSASIPQDVAVIYSGTFSASGSHAALAGYLDTNAGFTWLRDKMVLVPQGEYVPAAFDFILDGIGDRSAGQAFSDSHALTNGEIGNPAIIGDVRASLLFCSELLTPDFARELVTQQHANLLLIASSDALFRGGALQTDTLRFAKVQTVEAGVPSVSSVINDPGYALDKYGRITSYADAKNGTVAVGVATVFITP